MRDLTKLTRDEIGREEWAKVCRLLEQSMEWKAKYEETFAFYEDLRKQHDAMREWLEQCEAALQIISKCGKCWVCAKAARAALEGK